MSRWALLAHAAETQQGEWTTDQTRLAFDLLATPLAFREGRKPGAVLDFEGRVIDAGDDLAAVARREVAILKETARSSPGWTRSSGPWPRST